ncbi:hypothetical protein HK405_005373, partial [Cladochytrium tenue]
MNGVGGRLLFDAEAVYTDDGIVPETLRQALEECLDWIANASDKLMFMVLNSEVPFQLLLDPYLSNALGPSLQPALASPKTLVHDICQYDEDSCAQLKEDFSKVMPSKIAVTMDGATRSILSIVPVTAHYIDSFWVQQSCLLSASQHAQHLLDVLKSFGIQHHISAPVLDNTSVNVTECKFSQLLHAEPGVDLNYADAFVEGKKFVSCFAHVLNLVVQCLLPRDSSWSDGDDDDDDSLFLAVEEEDNCLASPLLVE